HGPGAPGTVLLLLLLLLALSAPAVPEPEAVPEGASTLAFVFDVTGSMYDDLVQVIEGASKILETSLKRPKRPLYNFALVPFHDPEIGPVTITTDPKKFQFELRELYVQGGGDCPEMSIGAIKIALEISLPGSFIYVFTDARSKDYRLTHEVLQLIQQKQSQVVFVLTGDCDDRDHIGYKVYEEIASTSSGQIFHLDKKQVNEVLKWVEEAVQASKVHLLSTDHLSMAVNTWQIPFDPSLKEVTVSLSGPSPAMEIHNPLGEVLFTFFCERLNELLNIQNSAKVVNVKDPEPGTWTIKTSSSGRHSVRITGLSTIDFRAGFSRKPTLDFKKTSSRPVQGIPTFMLLNTTGILLPARVDRLELLSITGELLKTLPVRYYPDRKPYGLWNISDFIPPDEAFFVKITGYDKDGYLFQRVSSVLFSSIIPGKRSVMPLGDCETLLCLQSGNQAGVTLGSLRDSVGALFSCRESSSMSWDIAQVSVSDEGFYECVASSTAGTGRAQTFLDPPPVLQVPTNVTVLPGAGAVLSCLVLSAGRYNLTWQRHGRDARLQDPLRLRVLANLSLELRPARLSDAGSYSCTAANEGGSATASVFLTVQEPPRLVISPKNQTFTEGSEVSIRCSATGYPKPTVVWTLNDMFIIGSMFLELGMLEENLCTVGHKLRSSVVLENGMAVLQCSLSVCALSPAPPVFTQEPGDESVDLGSNVTLPCYVQGYPEPRVSWRRLDGAPLFSRPFALSSSSQLRTGALAIQSRSPSNFFLFFLFVQVSPLIGASPATANVIEGQQLTLPCVLLAGNPIPERRWIKNNVVLVPNPYVSVRSDGSLHLERVRLQDGGDYTCMASSVAGTSNSTTTVHVFGEQQPALPARGTRGSADHGGFHCFAALTAAHGASPRCCMMLHLYKYVYSLQLLNVFHVVVKPRVSGPGDQQGNAHDKPIEVSVIAGEDVTLPCEVRSLPPPIITWAKEMQLISPFSPRHTFLPSGSMKISETQVSDSGMYVCVATNIAGNVTQSVKLSVHVPPRIQRGPRVLKVQVGQRVELPCSAQGVPAPSVSWLRGTSAVPPDGGKFLQSPDGALTISSVQLPDAGIYTCVAANSAGSDTAEVTVQDLDPPFNSPFQERVANQHIAFPCPAKGTPKPAIKWLRNGRELSGAEPGLSVLEDGTLLVIAALTPSDSGDYVCVAANEAGSTQRRYSLKVHVPPEIRDQDKVANTSVVVHHAVSLFCEVTGNPSPVISWYKDDIQVCWINLTVDFGGLVPPSIIGADSPGEVAVILNQEIGLECRAKGFPVPDIHWFKDGKPLFLGDPNVELLDRDQVLQIKSARRVDKGRYQCSATNTAGKQVKEVRLVVHVPPSIKGGNITTEVSVLLNNLINLECETKGIPVPTITWYKDGQRVISSPQALYVDRGQFLQIPRAQVSDSAQYSCRASSTAGAAEKLFHVDVYVPPVIEGDADTAQSRQVVAGNSLTLECKAAGNPPPLLTWLKDGVPVKASEKLHVLAGGKQLEILNAVEADQGQYWCVATSIAGEQEIKYDVEILGLKWNFLFGRWFKDGQPLGEEAGHKVLLNGQKLVISQAQVSDSGRYKCVAANKAGEHEKEFDVTVHGRLLKVGRKQQAAFVSNCWQGGAQTFYKCLFALAGFPPAIKSAGPSERAVVLHKPVTLQCIASGIPSPSITWLKDGQPVNTARGNIRVLRIEGAQVADSGLYRCLAANAAGTAELLYSLQVHGECTTTELGQWQNKCSILQGALGVPPGCIWHWGVPEGAVLPLQVLSGGRVLALPSAQLSDTGTYTCVAVNAAGESQRDIDLRVYVPPDIVGEEQNVSVLLGQALELRCQGSAVPPPRLAWLRDGRPLLEKPGLSISADGSVLKVSRAAQVQDTGRYTCEATNVAGKTEKNYNVNIWVPCHFPIGPHPSEVVVTQGSKISLECEAQGIPEPAVTWLKDGRALGSGSGREVAVLAGGRVLRLQRARVSDTGRYVCVATNAAGLADRKYDLSVHGEWGRLGHVEIHHWNPISLVCEASGIPLPAITWLKNGLPITLNSSVRVLSGTKGGGHLTLSCPEMHFIISPIYFSPPLPLHRNPVPQVMWLKDGQALAEAGDARIVSRGRSLQISEAQLLDTGRYTCVASNAAGDRSKTYSLNVLVAPSIVGADSQGNAEDITVILNSPTSLVCEAYSYPPATITWLKDGNPLESSRNIRILPGGRTLQILNAQQDSAGRYTCIATNEAGETLRHYEVKVYIPPTIAKGDVSGTGLSPKEVKIKVNHSLTLECEVHAIPAAAISWYKDGQANLGQGQLGHTLHIKEAQVSDTGRYACLASNIAGEDELEFDVNIQVPPSFQKSYREWEAGNMVDAERGGESKDVIVNNPLSLYCETNAVPPPVLTWFKDGHPLSSSDRVLILPGGRVLQIVRARAADAGRYACVAVNEAGQDSIHYNVRVLSPPSISGADGDVPEEVTVLVSKEAAMECIPTGSPSPRITWQKDGQLLAEDDKHTLLSNGRRLQVVSSFLYVVGTNPENLTVVVNNFISLTCEVTGFPPPDLIWLKNGKPITNLQSSLLAPGARTLQIPRARLLDGGEYTCTARNQAGESQKKSFLTVLVPPSIKAQGGASVTALTVRVGTPVTLGCESNAIPAPVITWYKNGRLLPDSAALEVLADGQTLRIKAVSDTGQYVCKAINIAGRDDKNFHLNVYVPPSIEGPEQELVTESISIPVTFVCDATGIPPPTLVWLKNGKPIVHILSAGSKLQIARSQLLDSGTYTCIASNPEGKAQKSYVLSIQVPPSIAGSEMPSEVSVLLGESVQLLCNATGVPSPDVQWLKDGKTVRGTVNKLPVLCDGPCRVTPDGSTLNISRALTSDTGKYTCVATNPAGEEDRIFNLNVYVPPTIANSKDEAEELTALLDTSLNIECAAAGTPPPQLHWLKNGLPLSVSSQIKILSAGQILRLTRVQISDTGVYTCVASNRAGVHNKHYNLQVLVPPSLDNAGGSEEVLVLRGDTAMLGCVSDGSPVPSVSWLKDGLALPPGTRLSSGRRGMVLQVLGAEPADTGRYTCVASNAAGHSSKHFVLKVLEPPHINGSDEPEELSVIVNNPLELLCISSGIPVPKISWMKDGRPLLQTDNIHVLREALRITSAQVECLFQNRLIPPNISGTGGPQELAVLQNSQAILECRSDAVPPPTISWLKNGELLEVLSCQPWCWPSARCIVTAVLQVSCSAHAFCLAVAPTIRSSPQTVMVHINTSALLECAAEGVPAPRITWRKDGAPHLLCCRYLVLEDGSLHIPWAQVADTGRYVCMATNAAGSERQRLDLHVLVPPTIAPGQTNITVTVNVQTTLPCEATGIPRPAISWKKNGHPLSVDQNQNTYRLLSSGSLVIISPTVDDTAVYECFVSNDAGEDQRTIDLTVQVPPSIADEATELLVTKLSPVVVSCTASGVPIPSVHWTKNGIKLLPRGDGYRILSSGAVEIPSAQLAHGGRYTCVARNAAGSAHRHVTLHVQEPPVIQAQPGVLDVIVNNPIVLPCEATGTPQPVITWQKEGINIITTGNSYMVQPSGSLQITRAAVEDAGTYMCVAQNPAGTALGKIKLKVQVPPVIKSHVEEYVVAVDQSVTLQCEAEGYPGPEISWHKDGQQITESMRRRMLSTGALQILFPEDSGSYTCIATNAAGEDMHTVTLTVHVLPAFTELPGDVALTKGEQLRLTCKATGVPVPRITWTFNNNIIPGGSLMYDDVNGHSELLIERVSKEDSGTYVCSAENTVGSIKAIGFVYVKEPPVFKGDYHSSRIEPLGGNAMLNCEVRGDPPPTIQWSRKGVGVQISNRIRQLGNGSLAIYGTVNEDAGDYKCVATNDVGVVERSLTLTLQSPPVITVEPVGTVLEAGATAVLDCLARGEPPPAISWSRQGQPLLDSDRVTLLPNGSLRIATLHREDTSQYECVARNLLGSVLVTVPLTVQGGPARAKGSIIGNINDVEFGIAFLNATVTDSLDSDTRIKAPGFSVMFPSGPAMRKLVSILSPVYWTTAKEIGEAMNGFTLTDAVFKRETQVEFATGEILRMTHVARGLDTDGALLLDVVVSGHVLQLQSVADVSLKARVVLQDYTEDYIQTGPGQLHAHSTRLFAADGVSVPYTWNHSITYDPSKGRMPFLVQTLRAASITTEYHPLQEAVAFKIQASIAKGDRSNQCPAGFALDSSGPYCSDEDECAVGNPCSHTCHNAVGSYYCSCPKGFTISADGRTCQDIDECALGGQSCHAGQDCENLPGSFRCVLRCGSGFRRTPDGFSCQDVDECRSGSHQCRYNQLCENTRGSYRCVCPRGFRAQGPARPCVDINECEQVPKPCALHCTNTPGSFKCFCPPGQQLLGDGKSCAGLERVPNSGSHPCGLLWYRSLIERPNIQHSSHRCSTPSEKELQPAPTSSVCTLAVHKWGKVPVFMAGSGKAEVLVLLSTDIDECESRDTCQHECRNSLGSFQCVCPVGYHLMPNGKTCQDIDECLEEDINCGSNQMCFNMRGSYQCIDTPCPPNYQREPHSGYVLFSAPSHLSQYKLLSLPFGIAAGQDLIRLVAYTHDQVMHPRTTFLMAEEDPAVPFALRDENWKGVVFTTRALREPRTYRMGVRALSYSADGSVEYRTTFIIYIAVSAFPY
uniref:Hemicentin 1 n=1 Tax=Zonotrichia albicollis TaxID=44394 RepID=A0A8D2NA96_ZONAL